MGLGDNMDKAKEYEVPTYFDNMEIVCRKLFSVFNYSFLDVSAMRKCLGTLNEGIPKLIYKHKGNNHRSMKDCEECLKEFKVIQTLISIGVENIYSNEYLETIIELGFKDE